MKTIAAPLAMFMALASSLASAGCAKKEAAPALKWPVTTTAGEWNPDFAGGDKNGDGANGSANGENGAGGTGKGEGLTTQSLHLSETIAKACKLARPDAAPKFAFDSTTLPDGDREILSALARCLDGPLKGKTLLLVGRADARGENEYNMGLGEARSNVVKRYMVDLGIAEPRIRASSRGELDATGTTEDSMAEDRRVDIDVL